MHVEFDAIVSALKASIPILEQIAAFTPSKWDDTAVGLAKAVLTNQDLLNFFHNIFSIHEVVATSGDTRTAAIHAVMEATATPDVKAAALAAGFDWALLLQYLPQIVTFVLTMLGMRR